MHDRALKSRIDNYLYQWRLIDPDKWFPKGEIEDMSKGAGYLGDNGGRRLRELVEEGKVEGRRAGKSKEFRHL